MTSYRDDKPRLAAQTMAIVERLRRGPATNAELLSLEYVRHGVTRRGIYKYTSRISDARKHLRGLGEDIECTRISGGLTEYRIVKLDVQAPVQLGLRGVA